MLLLMLCVAFENSLIYSALISFVDSKMLESVLRLLFSILVVFASALLYVNSIEFLGHRYRIGGSFVGAIFSPLFTSLPELIVLLIAIFGFGGANGAAMGVGTIFGEPFMASSLSYGLVGILVLLGFLLKRRKRNFLEVDRTLAIPFIFVIVFFPLALVPSFIASNFVRFLFGVIFLVFYLVYLVVMYRKRTLEIIVEAEEPYFCRVVPSKEIGGFLQLAVSVILLYFGASLLVASVSQIAVGFGTSLIGISIIAIPAATAVPETVSALIWGFKGKDTLSIGSLVGEKVLYSTLYPAIGLFLTAWVLDIHAYISVLTTSVVSLLMLLFISKKRIPWYGLAFGLVFFAAYVLVTFWLRI
jgi:cation:H+ antiporter